MENDLILICECHSFEHQVIFWYDKEDSRLVVYVHLVKCVNFWKRMVNAVKYLFGYTSRYGEWDEFIFSPENESKLRDFLDEHKSENLEVVWKFKK